jgi:phenylacetate-CoA ligase
VATIARMDDMRKVKGVNVWPQAVDDLLFREPAVDEYRVVLTSNANEADVATLEVMPKPDVVPGEAAALRDRLAETLRQRIGIQFAVELVTAGSLARSEYKARRWRDDRLHARRPIRSLQAERGPK